jgi:hypothetical protein
MAQSVNRPDFLGNPRVKWIIHTLRVIGSDSPCGVVLSSDIFWYRRASRQRGRVQGSRLSFRPPYRAFSTLLKISAAASTFEVTVVSESRSFSV